MKKGFIWGKFQPMHRGHQYLIETAASACDRLLIIVCLDDKFTGDLTTFWQRRLQPNSVLETVNSAVRHLGNVDVTWVDETDCEPYPHGWDQFQDKVQWVLDQYDGGFTDFYTGDPELYHAEVERRFGVMCHDINREAIPCSATMIRESPVYHWHFLVRPFQETHPVRIGISGVESTGKTTLAERLSSILNGSLVEEYGRFYVNSCRGGNELSLTRSDYESIAHIQGYNVSKQTRSPVIVDAPCFITAFYQKLHLGEISPAIIREVKSEWYDLVIHMEPDVPWVDDGMRTQSSDEQRKNGERLLTRLYSKFRINHRRIGGGYQDRIGEALVAIYDLN